MKIKQLIEIQEIVEGRLTPYDMNEIMELEYYSTSKGESIKIGDLHLNHFLRIFNNLFGSKESLTQEIQKIKDKIKQIEDKNVIKLGERNGNNNKR